MYATVIFILWHATRWRDCLDCGAPLPVFCSPFRKTRRMWRAGGYLCARCGCEADAKGRKVADDAPVPPFPARHLALVGVLLFVGVGLGVALWAAGRRAVAAPGAVAPPPLVALPRQGPPRVGD